MFFDSIYKRWYKKSFAFAKSYLHDSMAAEDIVSESIIKLWKSMSESNIEHPDALLFTKCRKYYHGIDNTFGTYF